MSTASYQAAKTAAHDIVRGLTPFVQPGTVYELRILDCVDNPKYPPFTMFGYFDADHLDDLAGAALLWTPKAVGVYVTLNPVNSDLLARAANRIIRATKSTKSTSDSDIVARRRLTLDFDPERATGISATDEEKVLASQVAWTVNADLHSLGWPEPLTADSGNGYHLNYAVDLPTDDDGITELFLKALSARYSTPEAKVDASLFNPSRIIKLYGTWSRKGDSISNRPHRLTMVTSAPKVLEVVDRALLEEFIRENPVPEPEVKPAKSKPAARTLTKGGKTIWDITVASGDIPDVDLSPIDDFNDRADWQTEILEPHSWSVDNELSNGEVRWTRPGKNGGTSATTGHNKGFHVFTDSREAAPFEAGKNYSKFDAYSLLNHRGHHGDAVKDLVQLGYGRYRDNDGEVKQNPPPPGWRRETVGDATGSSQDSEPTRDSAPSPTIQAAAGPCPPTFADAPRPITAELLSVPSLDPRLIPEPLRPWLQDIAQRGCFPLEYPTAAAIVGLSGLTGKRIAIRPKRHDDWFVVPNLWGCLIGPSGVQKTPPVEEALRPLGRLAVLAIKAHEEAHKQFLAESMVADARKYAAEQSLKAAAKKGASDTELAALAAQAADGSAVEEPTCKRYLVNDATVEKLGELLKENPHGLTYFRDELIGFFKTMDRQGHEGDRGFLLESWNGFGSYTWDRIGRGTVVIPNVCLSIFGTIQPGPLARYLRGAVSGEDADGFIPRFQVAMYPDPPTTFTNVDRYPDSEAKNRAYDVFKAIDSMRPQERGCPVDEDRGIPYLGFCHEAQDFFDEWRVELETRLRSGQENTLLTSHLAKFRKLLPALAGLFHLIEKCSVPQIGPISLHALEAGAAWCELLEAHARKIYRSALDGDIDAAVHLAERIRDGRSLPNPFTCWEVARKGWSRLSTVEDVRRAVGILEDRRWVKVVEEKPGKQGGRPSEKVWINPTVHP